MADDIDLMSSLLLEQAKRFLEKAQACPEDEGRSGGNGGERGEGEEEESRE